MPYLLLVLCFTGNVKAGQTYTPSDVFAGLEYAHRILDQVLLSKGIGEIRLPHSNEKAAKPMHVYELHLSVLGELYNYAINNNRRPPPLAVSTPMKYTPTDVFYLTQLVLTNIEGIYRDSGGGDKYSIKMHANKTPSEVYQNLFALYYKLNRLNGKSKVSPSEVYAHIYRAKEDLQYSLLTLSKNLDDSDEEKKRLLVTAIYGMHPNGTVMPPQKQGKKPRDVMVKAFEVRGKLNKLRQRNKLSPIKRPELSVYGTVSPIDVFLQTQFVIAELNLLKIPMGLHHSTNSAKPVFGKTPSDVYYEMMHIDYMLDRLMHTL